MKYPSRRRKNLLILIGSVVGAVWLAQQSFFHQGLLSLGSFGYIGGFLGGVFFASSFTVAFSLVILATLAEDLSPILLALIAGLGAMIGDLLILHFWKEEIGRDLEPIYNQLGGGHIRRLLTTRYFSWTLPLIGAFIIASPLPDELGISLLGISKMPRNKFLLLSYGLNTLGILLITTAGSLL